MTIKTYKWSEIAFDKKPEEIKDKDFTFILISRDISERRILELFKEYIAKSNILWGIAEEEYIDGFDGQIQFETLKESSFTSLTTKLEKANIGNKLVFLKYNQRDTRYVLEALKPKMNVLVNGSWKSVFHQTQVFGTLVKNELKYNLVSAFTDEKEAKEYEKKVKEVITKTTKLPKTLKESEYLDALETVSKRSFDHSFQVGSILLKRDKVLASAHNEIVPFETYALLNGSLREKNFTPQNDLNFYDTHHSELGILNICLNKGINLKGTTLLVNLLPCPTCAKALAHTTISRVIYHLDHSSGYSFDLLKRYGIDCVRV
jgi:deoxycytidylate deaminase